VIEPLRSRHPRLRPWSRPCH